jgi:hypothetical protein
MEPVVGIPTMDGFRSQIPFPLALSAMTNGGAGLDPPGPLVGPTSKIALTKSLNLLSSA